MGDIGRVRGADLPCGIGFDILPGYKTSKICEHVRHNDR